MDQIISKKRWIIEGAHNLNWVSNSLKNADLIIFLDTPYYTRIWRITKRYLKQLIGVESANYAPTFKIFKNMFRWNHFFEKKSKAEIIKMFQQDKMNAIIVKDQKELDQYFN
ncbi:adenylate kinase family enzyme [Cytobacillus eiseniae]|uniref:Adenylate kinase family enzyme n=1 Tax=Cytobacillus eiseniae TaxID=762947 RepID=A0ABS4RF94_9BACI|nr:adenylate kinase family enzyme [Cytobacillus eiseniae]